MAVSDYSVTPGDNTVISGLAVSDATVVNTWDNIIRQLMADVRAADDANVKLTGNQTIAGTKTFSGSVVVATMDLNGGTIDATSIGATTPANAIFNYARITSTVSAILDFAATNVADTHERTRLIRNETSFIMQTVNAAASSGVVDYAATITATGAFDHSWRIQGTERFKVGSAQNESQTLVPQSSSNQLGANTSAATRWQFIYLQNSPVVTSDAALKSDIADLTEAERRAAAKIKPRTFVINGQKKVGYIAQEVIAAMASEGLDAIEYGLVNDGDVYGVDYDAINAFRLG